MQNYKFVINEIECKSIVNRSRIPDLDYTINPYTGCLHGCVYCYARFMTRYTKHDFKWGRFVDVKINAYDVLRKQMTKLPQGLISLSTVTDPYQSIEKKYQITRQILGELAGSGFGVSVLTRSDLVVRDIDIFKQFSRERCDVGFSMATFSEEARKYFEPMAPSIQRRIEALGQLHNYGIRTWVFLAPLLPSITDLSLMQLLEAIKESVDYILVDKLNIKSGNWAGISEVLQVHYPDLMPHWRKLLFSKEKRSVYNANIYRKIADFCDANRISVRFC